MGVPTHKSRLFSGKNNRVLLGFRCAFQRKNVWAYIPFHCFTTIWLLIPYSHILPSSVFHHSGLLRVGTVPLVSVLASSFRLSCGDPNINIRSKSKKSKTI